MGHSSARAAFSVDTVWPTHVIDPFSTACWLFITMQCSASFWLIIDAWVTVVSWIYNLSRIIRELADQQVAILTSIRESDTTYFSKGQGK